MKVTDVSQATRIRDIQVTAGTTRPVVTCPLLTKRPRSGERVVGLLLTLLMLFVSLQAMAQTTSLPLGAGQQLERDRQYASPDGSHFLIFQGDGNLVVARTSDKGFVWGLNTVGGIEFQRAAKVGMDASGHLYANENNDAVVWLTPKDGAREGSTLNLTDSGELRVVAPDGSITWSSADATRTITEKPLSTIKHGSSLERNVHYVSESGQHYLVFLGDGNLVVARKADNGYVWGLNSVFNEFYGTTMVDFSNGALSAINENINKHKTAGMEFEHPARWQTMGRRDYAASARLVITQDGVLQIVSNQDILFATDGNIRVASTTPAATPAPAAPAPAPAPTPAPVASTPGTYMLPIGADRQIKRGDKLTIPSGLYTLKFNDDGNLMVLAGKGEKYIDGFYNFLGANGPWKQAHTAGITPDGNFALFDQSGKQVWSTSIPSPSAGSQLVFSDMGTLQVRRPSGDISWSMDKRPSPSERQGSVAPGASSVLDEEQKSILDTHNRLRAQHKVPALKWSTVLAAEAQKFANACVQDHGTYESRNGSGENLAAYSDETMADRVENGWYAEVAQYDYSNPGYNKKGSSQQTQTGHFTQMVWAATTDLGCARKDCPGRPWKGFMVCRYWPAGNGSDPGESSEASAYRRNVLPKQ